MDSAEREEERERTQRPVTAVVPVWAGPQAPDRVGSVRNGTSAALDLSELLSAVEAAPPIAAAEVLAAALAETIDAQNVSFLIADFSGQSLVRLSHVERGGGALGRERGETVPMVGTPYGRALTGQALEVRTDKGAARLYAPVSSRGEAVGVLELWLAREPDAETLAAVSAAAHALAYVGDREPTLHGSFRVGPAVRAALTRGGDP